MSQHENTRRDFIKIASAAVMSGSIAAAARPDSPSAPTILNHNPSMNYRRLGKTEFMISEIALGGHGAHGYDDRAVRNRIPVLERAIELGMNYVDTNIGRECDVYARAMARSATAKRERLPLLAVLVGLVTGLNTRSGPAPETRAARSFSTLS